MPKLAQEMASRAGPVRHVILPPDEFWRRVLCDPRSIRLEQHTAIMQGSLYYSPGFTNEYEHQRRHQAMRSAAECCDPSITDLINKAIDDARDQERRRMNAWPGPPMFRAGEDYWESVPGGFSRPTIMPMPGRRLSRAGEDYWEPELPTSVIVLVVVVAILLIPLAMHLFSQ